MEEQWQYPHRRWNPLRRSWVLVSPHRAKRPWLGEVGKAIPATGVRYDPECYLCPGNKRTGGEINPDYGNVFSFVNDFAALLPDPPALADQTNSPLLTAEAVRGLCKVLCFHPDHSQTLATMQPGDIRRVVDAWADETAQTGALDWINYVQIFENRGAMMGASMPHPHCQVWSSSHIPDEPALETEAQQAYLAEKGSCLLCDYLAAERDPSLGNGQRIIFENDSFTVLVPWWAVWPFETLILSRRHCGQFLQLAGSERDGLADVLKRLTSLYDKLFDVSFPYTMGFHQSPTDGKPHPEWHFHAHFYPPLLRSATVKKFMVGFEMLGQPQRDITPESAAARLRILASA